MKDSLKIAIAGATGYTGLELTKILSSHTKAKILYLCAQKSIGKPISFFDKRIKKAKSEAIEDNKRKAEKSGNVLTQTLNDKDVQLQLNRLLKFKKDRDMVKLQDSLNNLIIFWPTSSASL